VRGAAQATSKQRQQLSERRDIIVSPSPLETVCRSAATVVELSPEASSLYYLLKVAREPLILLGLTASALQAG
jgi:hypothetical protein